MATKTIRIAHAGDTAILSCDLSDASAPLVVDGDVTQYQTADARHRTHLAVALAASVAWPDETWPEVTGDHPISDDATDAWSALEYETVDPAAEQLTADTITDEQIEALRAEAAEAGDPAQVAICTVALYGVDGVDRNVAGVDRNAATDEDWAAAVALGKSGARAACADAINEARAACASRNYRD